MGVNSRISGKAEEDYLKRTSNAGSVDKNAATFVFATPRRWAGAERWAAEKRQMAQWRDVRVLWSQHMERWLDRAPWIAAGFCRDQLGRAVRGIESLGMIGDSYVAVADPTGELDPNFVIAGRTSVGADFVRWATVADAGQFLRVSASTEREVLDYLAATVRLLPPTERERLESRVFVVDDPETVVRLGNLRPDHVILARHGQAIPHAVMVARRWNCRMAIVGGRNDSLSPEAIPRVKHLKLEPMPKATIVDSLTRLGYSAEEAGDVCNKCDFDYARIRKSVFLD
jgi:hypothetical protein